MPTIGYTGNSTSLTDVTSPRGFNVVLDFRFEPFPAVGSQ